MLGRAKRASGPFWRRQRGEKEGRFSFWSRFSSVARGAHLFYFSPPRGGRHLRLSRFSASFSLSFGCPLKPRGACALNFNIYSLSSKSPSCPWRSCLGRCFLRLVCYTSFAKRRRCWYRADRCKAYRRRFVLML